MIGVTVIRISCAGLVRLTDKSGRYALLGSRSKYASLGRRILSPIGGAIEFTEVGRSRLVKDLGVDPASFEGGRDLRFRIDESRLDGFRTWLGCSENIEADPARREMVEELGPQEHGILSLPEANMCSCVYENQTEDRLVSTRRGQEGVETQYFLRLYRASVPDSLMVRLLQAAEQPDNLLEFVSEREILQGCSRAGSEIATVSKSLLVS